MLENLKVVELASVLAGPSVGQFFVELGAEVTKIENKLNGGDVTRSWKLASEDPKHPFSAYYSSVNYGKKSLLLNLKDQKDFSQVISIIKNADVVICNFKPGDAQKFGLDYDSLQKINSRLIYGEITGFGNSNRLAYDIVLQAETGFLAMNGTIAGELCKMPVAFIDLLAAHQLKEGILIALLKRNETQIGMKVSVSLFDSAIASLANQATNWLMAKHIPKPMGTLHPNIAPYGEMFNCTDQKKVVLAIGSNKQFKNLCLSLSLREIPMDSRFKDKQSRIENRKILEEILANKIVHYKRDELMKLFLKNQVPAGAVRKMNEVFELTESQNRILKENKEGHLLISVKGNAFKLEY